MPSLPCALRANGNGLGLLWAIRWVPRMPLKHSFHRSVSIDVDHGLGKVFRGFLGQIVSDAAADQAMRVFACEFLRVGTAIGMRRAVAIALKCDSGDSDRRRLSKPFFKIVVFGFAIRKAHAPAIIVDHDANMVRVFEGRCCAIERSIVEVPFRRSELPDQLAEIMAVFFVA
jgi:hypothetical protein